MNLTKKQKGYAAVLAVLLTAFLADRLFFLPDGAEAVAQEDPRDLLIQPQGGVAVSVSAAGGPQRSPYRVDLLAERLSEAAGAHRVQLSGVRDAFLPSAAWVAAPKVIVHDTAAEAAQAFRAKYRLTAIFLGPGGGTAMIDGRAVRVGQRLGGWTLAELDARSATFDAGGYRLVLVLDADSTINAE